MPPIPNPAADPNRHPAPYALSLTPAVSHLRPHCLAKERLRLWTPLNARNLLDTNGSPVNLPQEDLMRIRDVLAAAYADSTVGSYGSGLLVYHVYCDRKEIPEEQRSPVSNLLLSAFIATLCGAYAGGTIANYVNGVRAWHIIHGLPWQRNKAETDALIKATKKLTPPESKKEKRQAYTTEYISQILQQLDTNNPADAAVHACLTTTFWASARVGETTVKKLDGFDPAKHATIANVKRVVDREGLEQTEIFLPWTKCAPTGEPVCWARQDGPTDPQASFDNHVSVNRPQPDEALFSHTGSDGKRRPLTHDIFIRRIKAAARAAGLPVLQGHGIRIGATLEYLLRRIPFEVVKVKGRWASDAFLGYLRRHTEILAPYMQAQQDIMSSFLAYTALPALPRVAH